MVRRGSPLLLLFLLAGSPWATASVWNRTDSPSSGGPASYSWEPLVSVSSQLIPPSKQSHRVHGLGEQTGPPLVGLQALCPQAHPLGQASGTRAWGTSTNCSHALQHLRRRLSSPRTATAILGLRQRQAAPGCYRSVTLFSTAAAICWSR